MSKQANPAHVVNPIPPVFDARSRVLILGTMPSPKSRSAGFFYSHPQNRFWKTLSAVLEKPIPETPEGRREFLVEHRIAMWDVLASCEIASADDASIKAPVANDMSVIFAAADIRAVFTTGKKAFALYKKYCMGFAGAPGPVYLPSTSPANQGNYPLASLTAHYRAILEYL